MLPWEATIGVIERRAAERNFPDSSPSHKCPQTGHQGQVLIQVSRLAPKNAVYILCQPPKNAGERFVIYFHGVAQQLAGHTADLLAKFGHQGFGAAAIEYPGYGLATRFGPPCEKAIYEDAQVGIIHLIRRFSLRKDQIVLFGYSLGTGVAAEMARRGFGGKLILGSPYTSIPEVASAVIPIIPEPISQLLVRDRFDTGSKAGSITITTLILHGTADTLIPFSMSVQLAQLFPDCILVPLKGADHYILRRAVAEKSLNRIMWFISLR